MRKSHIVVESLAGVLFGVMTLLSSQVFAFGDKDTTVCYLVRSGEAQQHLDAYTFNVKKHSNLWFKPNWMWWETGNQEAYSVAGKAAFDSGSQEGGDWLGSIYGTALVHKTEGARLAFTRTAYFRESGALLQHFDCFSEESSPTPSSWWCQTTKGKSDPSLTPLFELPKADPANPADRDACNAWFPPFIP